MLHLVRLIPLLALVLAAAALPLSTTTPADAAEGDRLFAPVDGFTPSGRKARVEPREFQAVRADLAAIRARLAQAPEAEQGEGLLIDLPAPDGSTERFRVWRTQVMMAELAAAHPELATYAGQSVDTPGATVALDVTPMGFHAAVRGAFGQRAWYVDPAYDRRGTTTHVSYHGAALPEEQRGFVEREARRIQQDLTARAARSGAGGGLVERRFYRLAMVSDPTYAEYFGSDNVLAEKVTLVNRVNQVYNDDLGINLRLVNETDDLNLDTEAKATGPDGPCGAHPCFDPGQGDPESDDYVPSQIDFCDVPTLGRNRTVLGQLVGASGYDVGHLALGVNGGGIAYLGVVGWDYKGGGCTGLPEPKGDFFAIDYVAHELGHQYAGSHTFNGTEGACPFSRAEGASVEPGSGSSVMAYAGICGRDDLQPHTDPYFSQRTLEQVHGYTGAELPDVVEVQTVSLRDFDEDGEQVTLTQGADSVTLTRGVDYDAAGVEAAVEQLTGEDVTIAQWGYDPFDAPFPDFAPVTGPDDTGFQVIFADTVDPEVGGSHEDQPALRVSSDSPGVSGFVGETAQGGPADNAGWRVEETRNRAPVARAPRNRTLPMQTPFTLKGRGSDADGDRLTYLWEQNDLGGPDRFVGGGFVSGGTSLTDNTKRNGPLFRVFSDDADVSYEESLESPSPDQNTATASGRVRTFPDLAQVVRGNTNARTGRCPAPPPLPSDPEAPVPALKDRLLDCYSEFLPVKGYVGTAGSSRPAMHFRLTVRDGFVNGGGTAYDDVTLRLAPNRGPFLVTSQARRRTAYSAGERVAVRWQVNGTRALAARVRVRLSTDGGRTFDRVLVRRTANDGKVRVRLPRTRAKHARIMVEARGNYFFDVNDRGFRIR